MKIDKDIKNIVFQENLELRVDTAALLKEVAECGGNVGILKIPLNIFTTLLWQVAQRATEINDPELNILMLKLTLYEIQYDEFCDAIKYQEEFIKNKNLKTTL